MKRTIAALPLGLLLAFAPALMAQKPAAAPKGAHPKSKAEAQALKNLQNMMKDSSTAPAAMDTALNSFVTQFPTSDYVATVSDWGLQYYQTPPHESVDKSLVYGEQAIKANPKDIFALTSMCDLISSQVKSTDLNADTEIKEGTDDANAALAVAQGTETEINGNPFTKPERDEVQATAYSALARLATVKNDLPSAVEYYQKAIPFDDAPHQARDNFYMARAYIEMKRYDEANKALDAALAAQPNDPNVQAAVASNKKLIEQLQKQH